VQDIPSITVEGGETTEVGVRLETASIPRMERHRKRRRTIKRFIGAVLLLGLLSGAAWGTWTYAIPHTAVIPELEGRTVEAARDRLTELGFEVVLVGGRNDMQVPAGHVLVVRPSAGATLDQGTRVTIVPSKGPPPVAVPSVIGDPLKKAKEAMRDAGLRITSVKHRFDGRVPVDHVISQHPATGRIPKGSAVSLVVSDGPKPVPIPDVRGMAQDRAVKVLGAKGFEVVIEEAFSKQVARGDAVGTDPATGSELQPGETIVLTVSLGPEYFDCPDFFGMSVDEARAVAGQHGLELTALPVPGSSGNSVVSQIPGGGTRIRYGSTVTVYYA
jgi:serine/threonine-protein kinase